MEAIEAIMTRRSIRKYSSQPVSDEVQNVILRAGMAAPSAGDQRPWHFVVIRDKSILDKIPEFHKHATMLKEAQVGILVCADTSCEKYPGRWPLDSAACTQNILLAAHSMGLGAVWVGIYPVEERMKGVSKLLGIPDGVKPVSIVSLGYPAEKKEPDDRFDPSRIHSDKW